MTVGYIVGISIAFLVFVGWMAWELTHPLNASDEHDEAVMARDIPKPH